MEIGTKSDDDSIMPPLISEEGMNTMSSGDEFDAEPISTDILEDICDGSQSHPSINRRGSRYKILDCIKRGIEKCKGSLIWVKVYKKYLRLLVTRFCKAL